MKILVLDDSEQFKNAMRMMLKRYDVKLFLATTLSDIDGINLSTFELAFIDLNLEEGILFGIQACETLIKNGLTCPTIAISGYHRALDKDVNLFNDFLCKPPKKDELLHCIERNTNQNINKGMIYLHELSPTQKKHEISKGIFLIEKGVANHLYWDIVEGCSMLAEDAVLNSIPGVAKSIDKIKANAENGIIDLYMTRDLLSWIIRGFDNINNVQPPSPVETKNLK